MASQTSSLSVHATKLHAAMSQVYAFPPKKRASSMQRGTHENKVERSKANLNVSSKSVQSYVSASTKVRVQATSMQRLVDPNRAYTLIYIFPFDSVSTARSVRASIGTIIIEVEPETGKPDLVAKHSTVILGCCIACNACHLFYRQATKASKVSQLLPWARLLIRRPR